MATSKLSRFVATLVLVSSILAATHRSTLADPPKVALEKRVAWTTSRITGSPEVPLPYVTERAFPSLKFNNCLDITKAPGQRPAIRRRARRQDLFVLEQA